MFVLESPVFLTELKGETAWVGLVPRLDREVLVFAGLPAGEEGGVRPRGGLLKAGNLTVVIGFVVGGFAGCDTLESVAFAGHLDAELSFVAAVGFEDSGFLVAADVVAVVGFLTPVAEGGRPTSGAKTKTVKFNSPNKKTVLWIKNWPFMIF